MSVILLIEDEADIVIELKDYLEYKGHTVLTAADGVTGLQLAQTVSPDLVLLDIKIPELNGLEVLKQIRQTHPSLKVIVLTGFLEKEHEEKALSLGATLFLQKPMGLLDLDKALFKTLGSS